ISTFGRVAVEDGKFGARLHNVMFFKQKTAYEIKSFITENQPPQVENREFDDSASTAEDKDFAMSAKTSTRRKTSTRVTAAAPAQADGADEQTDRPFRFYDNRQKYLAFVNTTNEKWKVAERATRELALLKPRPP